MTRQRVVVVLVVGVVLVWRWPGPRESFERVYARVDAERVVSLKRFRADHPLRKLRVAGAEWEYVVLGRGTEALVFLHGMTGAYDIWWQQLTAFQNGYRVVSVTYPPVDSLGGLATGVLGILDREGVQQASVVGTSLGGYLAQYLMARHPDRVRGAVLANTFPPNDRIASRTRVLGRLLPLLPEWSVRAFFRRNFRRSIYPTSGYDELTLAFLNEIGYGRMTKAQVMARYRCLVERFDPAPGKVPVRIVESDNDPLVDLELRQQLKDVYRSAVVYTFRGAGHFPYLNRPGEYNRVLADFLAGR